MPGPPAHDGEHGEYDPPPPLLGRTYSPHLCGSGYRDRIHVLDLHAIEPPLT